DDNGVSPNSSGVLAALINGNEGLRFRAGVVCGGTDDLAVLALFDDVGAPTGGSGDDEEGREEVYGNSHQVVSNGAIPVEVGEHALGVVHCGFNALGDVEEPHVARSGGKL